LLIRVHDIESKKDGWISMTQIVKNVEDSLKGSLES